MKITGTLTRDPEMRYTPNGKAITSFAIQTDGVATRCIAWDELAEVSAEELHEGSNIQAEGYFKTRRWTNYNTGEIKEAIEFTCQRITPI
jgi:single-strand DNA-binding protein